jgi:signal transduction histidine kinase
MDAMSTIDEAKRVLTIRGRREARAGVAATVLAVQDAGIGFTPEQAERLFEAFYTTKAHGMGMGLAISRSIIDAHDGTLWAEANPGSGATFVIRLPEAGKQLA